MLNISVKKRLGAFDIESTFVADDSRITALFGCSGAGKTSVINMVAGLVQPDKGHIAVNGRWLFDSERKIHLPPEKRRMGYVFQDGRLFPHLSVRSNLTYGLKLVPAEERYVELDHVTGLLGIEHLLDRRPATLSGGEKQRVAIGRALLMSPSLLLMDEPLASLDSARKAEVLPFIAKLSRELFIPILYVSHSLDEILNLADTLVLMASGRVMAVGRLEELMNREDLNPFIGRWDYGAVISTEVEVEDDAHGLTYLRFPGGLLRVPHFSSSRGQIVRVRIRARDVAIALSHPSNISVQNIFPATVEDISENDGSLVDVRLNIGCPLIARITPRALAELHLRPGKHVFALVKSVAVSLGGLQLDGDG